MTLEEAVKIAATVLQAVAVVVTAIFASKGLAAWRRQQLGKRRIALAEEVLVAVYKARINCEKRDTRGAGG